MQWETRIIRQRILDMRLNTFPFPSSTPFFFYTVIRKVYHGLKWGLLLYRMFQKEMSYFGKIYVTSNLDRYKQTQLNPKLKPYRSNGEKMFEEWVL